MAKKYFERKGTDNYATPVNENDDALRAGDQLLVNGQEELSGIITFDKGGCVHSISVETPADLFELVICVVAEGPEGIASGYGHLEFTDQDGEVYKLKIFKSERMLHKVKCMKEGTRIVKVEWYS